MKKLITIVLALTASMYSLLYGQSLPAQEIRRIFPDTIEGGIVPRQIIAAQNGGFLVAGAIAHGGFIAKLNDCGDLVWFRTQLRGTATAFNGIAELPSGEMAVVGSCIHCTPGDTSSKAFVMKFDAVGTLLQDTTLGLFNLRAAAHAVIRTSTGGIALTGSFAWAGAFHPTRAFLTVLDENLQPDFWAEYHEQFYDEPRALTQTPDGGYVLAGYSFSSIPAPWQAQLFRTDAQGQLIWKRLSPKLHSYFRSVQIGADGAVVALGQYLVDTVSNRDVYLAVHDATGGNMLLDRHYGSIPANDEGVSLHAIESGFLVGAVWGQPRQQYWGTSDWIFRLDENYNLVEEEFFDSYLANHAVVNVALLSPDGRDYAHLSRRTFVGLARDIVFYKKMRQGRHTVLAQAPQHYQLLPRNTATNLGAAAYQGSLQTPGAYDMMRLDVFRNDVLVQTNFAPEPEQFSFQVNIPAELANYSFRLSGIKNDTAYLEADACDVVAGDAYIIQGQSNAAANIPLFADDSIPHAYRYHRNAFVRNFGLVNVADSLYRWRREADDDNLYADVRSGQWGLVMAEKIVLEQGIPVAIMNGGIGGIAIDQMMPNSAAPHSTAHSYGRFYQRMERAGLRDRVRAILFFQGETNALPGYNETVESYQNKYLQLRSYWQSDYSFEREYLFQIRPGCWTGNFHIIQEAQRRLAEELPQMQIMSSTGMNHDGCHYHYTNGYQRAGNDMYRLLAKDFYDAPTMPDIHPPTVDSAWFSACDLTQITLRLRHTADTYTWTPGWETDFRLEGAPATSVVSGQVAGHTVVLNLSAAATGFTGLSYVSHVGGADAPVKNANDIGMSAFYNMPLSICAVSSIEQTVRAPKEWVAYPNPTNGRFTLRLLWLAEVVLYDATGRRRAYGDYGTGEHELHIDGPAGTYILMLRHKEGVEQLRILRQ
ncbi:MAG: T9SS type A sorting domain-containing protein [Saprospiraceae bacterium]|nr:T9SS type A sorting domain-containing protein [Saprospiraceae bacterium]